MKNNLLKLFHLAFGLTFMAIGVCCLHAAFYHDGQYFTSFFGPVYEWIDGSQVLAGTVAFISGCCILDP